MASFNFPPLTELLPQRPPFLFIQSLCEISFEEPIYLKAQTSFSAQTPFYEGHFPQAPLTPGVILCESLFQTGSILLNLLHRHHQQAIDQLHQIGVVTRIQEAKFRDMVFPEEQLFLHVSVEERLDVAAYCKGWITRVEDPNQRKIVQAQFTCSFVSAEKLLQRGRS
jgi:3-hydroxyacyl-[acyl-carrier-protein] dehydratase